MVVAMAAKAGSEAKIAIEPKSMGTQANPAVKREYDYMLSYSPYDNVAQKDYPAMFVTAGFFDSQVSCVEPAKWVARLRANKTDMNELLLRTDMVAGHEGRSGRGRLDQTRRRDHAHARKLN
jgi:oligopeptidase B